MLIKNSDLHIFGNTIWIDVIGKVGTINEDRQIITMTYPEGSNVEIPCDINNQKDIRDKANSYFKNL